MKKPNILMICTDQQRYDTLGVYGNKEVKTPNIDKLAEEGVLFENAFCQSPVCTPSRSSFLTGRYPRTTRCRANGQAIPSDEKLLSRLLSDVGYTCGLSGKLHLSPCHPSVNTGTERRIDDGFGQFFWSHHPMPEWPTNEYTQWLKMKSKSFRPVPYEDSKYVEVGPDAEDHQTTWCAEKAIQFMETHADYEQPWFFLVNMFDPHHPFDPPKAYLERYLDHLDEIPLPNYVEGELVNKPIYQQIDREGAYGTKGYLAASEMNERDHRLLRAAYWAMCDLIDDQVGRMINSLERSGQLENTIVIFMSDHGELLGDHGMYLKGPHFYDVSVRVPLIINWSKLKGGRRIQSLVELVDIAPTLLEAVGAPSFAGMQGKSLWPLLKGELEDNHAHRADVYCESYDANFSHGDLKAFATMVRTPKHKLVLYHNDNSGELYNLEKDADETHNLWHECTYASIKLEMMQRLCNRVAMTVDPLPLRVSPW